MTKILPEKNTKKLKKKSKKRQKISQYAGVSHPQNGGESREAVAIGHGEKSNRMEEVGFEPTAFRLQSGRATTALHPRLMMTPSKFEVYKLLECAKHCIRDQKESFAHGPDRLVQAADTAEVWSPDHGSVRHLTSIPPATCIAPFDITH